MSAFWALPLAEGDNIAPVARTNPQLKGNAQKADSFWPNYQQNLAHFCIVTNALNSGGGLYHLYTSLCTNWISSNCPTGQSVTNTWLPASEGSTSTAMDFDKSIILQPFSGPPGCLGPLDPIQMARTLDNHVQYHYTSIDSPLYITQCCHRQPKRTIDV